MRLRLVRAFRLASRVSPRLAGRLALELFLLPARRQLDAVDAPVLARARASRIRLAAHELQVYEWGTHADAILLMHGWGSHAPRFGAFVDPLLAAGFRVLAVDAPAHGKSTGRQATLELFRAALGAVAGARGPVRGIVGHSMGASATVWQMAESPPAEVQAIVLVGMPRDVAFMMDSFAGALELDARTRAALVAAFTHRYGSPPAAFSAHAVAGRLSMPVLLVHDRADDVAPFAHAQALLPVLARGELVTTDGFAHSGALRDPPTIARIVDFLVRNSRG
jgi:pimeloyl-ACP methyl ester carboxylesterase